jgi:hypothetical protein
MRDQQAVGVGVLWHPKARMQPGLSKGLVRELWGMASSLSLPLFGKCLIFLSDYKPIL